MKFALLGSDDDTQELARAVAESAEHELAGRYVVSSKSGAAGIVEALEGQQGGDAWESVLLGTVADAVIVGRADEPEQFDEPLRRLAQEAVPTLVVHPACSALVALELEMIRGDTGALLVPYLPAAGHPAVRQLAAWIAEPAGPLGSIRQLTIERQLAGSLPPDVLRELARDAHLVRLLLGEVDKVSALGGDQTHLENLGVQMTTADGVVVRWSAGPLEGEPGAKLAVVGEKARAELAMTGRPEGWRLELGGQPQVVAGRDRWNPAAAAVAELSEAVAGRPPHHQWSDACRSLEIVEGVERSLQRGRTIELFHEQPTEEETFKSMMAAGGCLLLMLSLFLAVLVGVLVDGLKLPWLQQVGGGILRRSWPWLVALPLVLFTVLQLLRFVFPSARRPEESDEADLNG